MILIAHGRRKELVDFKSLKRTLKNQIKEIYYLLSAGIFVGFLVGIVFSVLNILPDQYFKLKMYRLIVLIFDNFLIHYVLLFTAALFGLYIIWSLITIKIKIKTSKTTILMLIVTTGVIINEMLKAMTHESLLLLLKIIADGVRDIFKGDISFIDFLMVLKNHVGSFSLIAVGILFIVLSSWLITKRKREITLENKKTKYIRTTGVVLLIFLAIFKICVIVDGKTSKPNRPNIVWILIDALRADHLGCYGYRKNTSPFIDKFANENILFNHAFSQESYTQASVPSYFTSTYPSQHKVLYDHPTIDKLAYKFITIAEILRNDNYHTAAFVFNPHLKAKYNFDQGFDLYDDNKKGWDRSKLFHETFETAKKIYNKTNQYLKENKKRPVFLYLHYRDVHAPYAPPPPYHKHFLPPDTEPVVDIIEKMNPPYNKKNLEIWLSQYDGEIKYTDDYLEKTLNMLDKHNIKRENSIIIITSDHGEEFLDYHPEDRGGKSHGRTLYREQIHVPLIFSVPGMNPKQKKIDSFVELTDIVPTLLDILNIDWKKYEQLQGRSLLPLVKTEIPSPRVIYSGGNYGRGMIIEKEWKYYNFDKFTKRNAQECFKKPKRDYHYRIGEQLYNIQEDPFETKNLIHKEKAMFLRLKEKFLILKERLFSKNQAPSSKLDDKTREQLRSLGYIK